MTRVSSEVSLPIKYLLFFINFIIFIVAFAFVVLMAWVIDVKDKKIEDAYDFFFDPACVLCLVGCAAFVAALVGWVGPFRENIIILKIYTFMMSFWFVVQIVFVILIFVSVYAPETREQLGIYPEKTLKEAVVQYLEDEDLRNLVNTFQEKVGCCGTTNDDEGYKDWSNNEYYNCSVTEADKLKNPLFCSVPYSCCKENTDGLKNYACGEDMQSEDVTATEREAKIYTKGCFKALSDIMQANVIVVGGVLIGIFVPQVLMSWMANKLAGQIQAQRRKWQN